MANVILQNRTKRPARMIVLNLTKTVAAVPIVNRTVQENRQGERRKRISTKLVPDSIRIPAGGKVEVPEAALGCPEVSAAIARRDLLVVRLPPVATNAKGADDEDTGPKPRRRRG